MGAGANMGEKDTGTTLTHKSRRKACDLCFKKKIKCDRAAPRCSHCKIYKAAACTYTPLKRTPNPNAISRSRADVLETRLRELEARLRAFEGNVDTDQSTKAVTQESHVEAIGNVPPPSRDILALTPDTLSDFIGSEGIELRTEGCMLPPLRNILPSVAEYFATCNRIVPLFHEPTFMRMLRNWYSTPTTQQDPAVWATINIVLALGRRHTYIDISSPRGTLDVHVRNAQSVLSHLVTRDEDELGIQVVLGLAFIFYGTSDPKPATVLIATAVRLSHTLRLNTLRGTDQMDPDTMKQRQRIFWILYALDRDVALRLRQPAMINEQDIDLELPEEKPSDGVGIFQADDRTSINLFRKRVQFAWIQGKTYEWLISVRAEKLPQATRDEHTKRLERALDQWYASLPAAFQPELLPNISDPTTFRAFMVMHFMRLQVLARIHNSYAYDAQWIQSLRNFSDAVVEAGPSTNAFSKSSLPESFGRLVVRSRECLRLFAYLPHEDLYLVWSICCAYFSCVIFLIVNNLADPLHPFVDEDQKLIDSALQTIERLEEETGHDKLGTMRMAIAELDSKTRLVVDRARSHRLQQQQLLLTDSFDVSQFDADFVTLDPAFLAGERDSDDRHAFAADPASSNTTTALDTELFSTWLETQYFDAGVSYAESATLGEKETPNFDRVVAAFLKQSWF